MINSVQNISNLPYKRQQYNINNGSKTSFGSSLPPHEIIPYAMTLASFLYIAAAKFKANIALKAIGEKPNWSLLASVGKLGKCASTDKMTGLLNKPAMLTYLEKEYQNAIKHGQPFSVAILDMDNFKSFNELFGHDTGDIILKRVTANIRQVTEKYKLKGFRFGGEEFVITFPNHKTESAKEVTEEIAELIRNDEVIQSYKPEYLRRISEKSKFLQEEIRKIENIFLHLRKRKEDPIRPDYNGIRNDIIEVLETFKKRSATDNDKTKAKTLTNIDKILQGLKDALTEELPTFLRTRTPDNKTTMIAKELDKTVQTKYKNDLAELTKWEGHITGDNNDRFTISGGIAKATPEAKSGWETLKNADRALFSAKDAGKNTIVVYD